MGPVERFLQRNFIFHQEIRKMAQTKSEGMLETKSADIDVLRAEAGHEDGGGGPTLSSDASLLRPQRPPPPSGTTSAPPSRQSPGPTRLLRRPRRVAIAR